MTDPKYPRTRVLRIDHLGFPLVRTTKSPQKLVALILGLGLVAALVIAGTTSGFGGPSLPADDVAFVEDAADGDITQEEFDAAIEQAAARQQLPQAPEPGTPQYDLLKESAMGELLVAIWARGEAADLGIEVTDREIDAEREKLIQEQFGSEKAFQKGIKDLGYTEEEARGQIELQVIGQRVQEKLSEGLPEVSDQEVSEFYGSNIAQFTTPESRDVRKILNPDETKAQDALADLQADDSPGSWKQVAQELSTDEATAGIGGLSQALVEGQSEPELDTAVFDATEGELVGPLETPSGFYVFQVTKVNPETTQELDDPLRDQIRQTLASQQEQAKALAFQQDFLAKWKERTVCADDYVIDRCSNAPPAPDACTGDDDGEEVPVDPATNEPGELACPAFVPSTRPVPPSLAGQVGATGLPQGPIAAAPAAVPGAVPIGIPGGPGGVPVVP